ncbi:FAD-binding oxidoreductase, partial [Thioclava sp. BHET1]
GMNCPYFHGGVVTPLGFALNPRKYALGIAHAALDLGVRIHGNSAVQEIRREGEDYILRTATGQLRARHLILATNGYSSDNLPDWMRARFLPVQSSIAVTRELTEEEIAAQGWSTDLMSYDTRHLLHYFRLMPNRRFLFGMRGGLTWTPAAQAEILRELRADLARMFPAWADVELPYYWSGLANLARDLVPFVGKIGDWPRAHAGFAWHGNGVAMASWAGDQLARLALGQPHQLPDFYQAPRKRFELGRFRRQALRLAYHFYKFEDRG